MQLRYCSRKEGPTEEGFVLERGIAGVERFETHVALFTHDVPAFENLANLDRLPARGFEVVALPMKIGGGSGGPLRAIAIVPAKP